MSEKENFEKEHFEEIQIDFALAHEIGLDRLKNLVQSIKSFFETDESLEKLKAYPERVKGMLLTVVEIRQNCLKKMEYVHTDLKTRELLKKIDKQFSIFQENSRYLQWHFFDSKIPEDNGWKILAKRETRNNLKKQFELLEKIKIGQQIKKPFVSSTTLGLLTALTNLSGMFIGNSGFEQKSKTESSLVSISDDKDAVFDTDKSKTESFESIQERIFKSRAQRKGLGLSVARESNSQSDSDQNLNEAPNTRGFLRNRSEKHVSTLGSIDRKDKTPDQEAAEVFGKVEFSDEHSSETSFFATDYFEMRRGELVRTSVREKKDEKSEKTFAQVSLFVDRAKKGEEIQLSSPHGYRVEKISLSDTRVRFQFDSNNQFLQILEDVDYSFDIHYTLVKRDVAIQLHKVNPLLREKMNVPRDISEIMKDFEFLSEQEQENQLDRLRREFIYVTSQDIHDLLSLMPGSQSNKGKLENIGILKMGDCDTMGEYFSALHEQAGLPSGLVVGFEIDGNKLKSSKGHAKLIRQNGRLYEVTSGTKDAFKNLTFSESDFEILKNAVLELHKIKDPGKLTIAKESFGKLLREIMQKREYEQAKKSEVSEKLVKKMEKMWKTYEKISKKHEVEMAFVTVSVLALLLGGLMYSGVRLDRIITRKFLNKKNENLFKFLENHLKFPTADGIQFSLEQKQDMKRRLEELYQFDDQLEKRFPIENILQLSDEDQWFFIATTATERLIMEGSNYNLFHSLKTFFAQHELKKVLDQFEQKQVSSEDIEKFLDQKIREHEPKISDQQKEKEKQDRIQSALDRGRELAKFVFADQEDRGKKVKIREVLKKLQISIPNKVSFGGESSNSKRGTTQSTNDIFGYREYEQGDNANNIDLVHLINTNEARVRLREEHQDEHKEEFHLMIEVSDIDTKRDLELLVAFLWYSKQHQRRSKGKGADQVSVSGVDFFSNGKHIDSFDPKICQMLTDFRSGEQSIRFLLEKIEELKEKALFQRRKNETNQNFYLRERFSRLQTRRKNSPEKKKILNIGVRFSQQDEKILAFHHLFEFPREGSEAAEDSLGWTKDEYGSYTTPQ